MRLTSLLLILGLGSTFALPNVNPSSITCPATTLTTSHVTALGTAVVAGTFSLSTCQSTASQSTYSSGTAYSTPSGSSTTGQLTIGTSGASLTSANTSILGTTTCTLRHVLPPM